MTRAAGSLGKCNFGLYFARSCCGAGVAGRAKAHGQKLTLHPGTGTLDRQRAREGGDQALDVPEILMRQPDCLFPPTRRRRVAQSLDRRGRSELNRNTTEMNRAHTAACRGGEEALIMRLAVGYYDDNRWGEASRAPIDGPPIAPQQSGFCRASSQRCRGSSSSVYLFALEAYSSPIPTASAMGLIERRRRLEVGGWSMVAKGRRRRGTWADRQTGGMSLSLQTRTAGAVCASDLSKNKKQE
jgi:hypothetical protein